MKVIELIDVLKLYTENGIELYLALEGKPEKYKIDFDIVNKIRNTYDEITNPVIVDEENETVIRFNIDLYPDDVFNLSFYHEEINDYFDINLEMEGDRISAINIEKSNKYSDTDKHTIPISLEDKIVLLVKLQDELKQILEEETVKVDNKELRLFPIVDKEYNVTWGAEFVDMVGYSGKGETRKEAINEAVDIRKAMDNSLIEVREGDEF